MSSSIKKTAGILIPLFLGLGIIYYQYTTLSHQDLEKIKSCFKKANYFYIYLSFPIIFFGFWARAYRWKYALNHLGYQTHFKNDFLTVCISYLVNLTVPRSGEITRAALLKKYENVPFDKGFGTIVAERIVDLALFFIFVVIGFIIQFDKLYNFIFTRVKPQNLIVLAAIGIIGFALFLYLWIYSHWKIIKTIKNKLSGLAEGFLSIFKMENKWRYLLLSISIWISYLLMFYITIFALPETKNISFAVVVMAFIFGSLAIGFTNGGLGAYPLSIAKILLLYGITNDVGTAFGWLVWTSQTLFTIIVGLIAYVLLPILNRKK